MLKSYGAHSDAIAFVSLRASADRPPARVEMPRWLVESGGYRRALECLRAELIAGNGYPYAIETADAVACLAARSRRLLADRAAVRRRNRRAFHHLAQSGEADVAAGKGNAVMPPAHRA